MLVCLFTLTVYLHGISSFTIQVSPVSRECYMTWHSNKEVHTFFNVWVAKM